MKFNKISVIGLGYIGLPTAAMFASRKIKVIGVEINQKVVDIINQGKIHIVEPELDILVQASVQSGYLKAVTEPEMADAFLIAVPTPLANDNQPDVSAIEMACKKIAPVLKRGDLVMLESTSPVGTTEKISVWLATARPDLTFPHQHGEDSDIRVAHCPERVLPGQIVHELVQNDRVIGGITKRCALEAVKLYKSFVQGNCIVTNARTAELAKLTENSFRDVNIAFANELSMICDRLEINVWELIKIANLHPRVNILQPGPGVGGHCIAVDPWFIVSAAPEEAILIKTAREVNNFKPEFVLEKILKAVSKTGKPVNEINIALLGLAFKANIDDLRESPAVGIAKKVLDLDFKNCFLVEPNIEVLPDKLKSKNSYLSDIKEGIDSSDIVVLLVDHKEFKEMDPIHLVRCQVIDTRGVWQNSGWNS